MIGDKHLVEFEKYCDKCLYKDKSPSSEPCDTCLGIAARADSRKPECFVEDKTKSSK